MTREELLAVTPTITRMTMKQLAVQIRIQADKLADDAAKPGAMPLPGYAALFDLADMVDYASLTPEQKAKI